MSSDVYEQYGQSSGSTQPSSEYEGRKPRRVLNRNKKSAFTIKSSVSVELDFDMALALGRFIVDSRPENTAVMALGHQLCNLAEEEEF